MTFANLLIVICFMGMECCSKQHTPACQYIIDFWAEYRYCRSFLKGQCHKIFCFSFFPCIIFPQAPENNFRVISNFLKISRSYIRKSRCTNGIIDTGGNLATGFNDAGGRFAAGVNCTSIIVTGGKYREHYQTAEC